MKLQEARDAIAQFDPDCDVEQIVFCGEGLFFSAFLVNGHRIYRFAQSEEAVRTLAVESAVLPLVGGMVDLPVPCFSIIGEDAVAYEMIYGAPLTSDGFLAMSSDSRARAVAMIGEFLRQLRAIDCDRLAELGVIRSAYPFARTETGIRQGTAAALYAEDLEQLRACGLLDGTQLSRCVRASEALVADAERAQTALVHGDLSPEHILHDPASGWICGVIDFSSVLLTDPRLDLAYLVDSFGDGVLEGRPDQERASVLRLAFWHTALRLIWAAAHEWDEGIAHWRARLQAASDTGR